MSEILEPNFPNYDGWSADEEPQRELISGMPQLFDEVSAVDNRLLDLQIERLIALLRIVLTFFCLVFFIAAPSKQSQYESVVLILALYTLFGTHVLLQPIIGILRKVWQFTVHLSDIGIIITLKYILGDNSNTFLIFYVFVFLSATIRWNWRGALWTTALLVVPQIVLFVFVGGGIDFLVQYTFLTVIGGMFVFFGASREQSHKRLVNLAAWPSTTAFMDSDIDNKWLDASLKHVAAVLEVPRVLLLWEVAQEPYLFTALFADDKCTKDNKPTNAYGPVVAPELADETFASEALGSFYCTTSTGSKLFLNLIVPTLLQKHFAFSSVCSAPFAGEICSGRVFVLDRKNWGADDLALTKVVASRLRIQLEHHALNVRLKDTTANRERSKLARDLHDGILQSLTAAGLQLKALASRAEDTIRSEVDNVRNLLQAEQKRIRGFVEGRKDLNAQDLFELSTEMQHELEVIRRQWACDVALSVSPEGAAVSREIGNQLEFILAEASANAVQHGQASRIEVAIETISDRIRLRISDNGQGLEGATRTFSESELSDLDIGPQSLRKRIAELNGSLSLINSPQGVELCIELPGSGGVPT